MNWKFTGERPVYQQIVATIRAAILTGELAPGGKIPSVRDFAAEAQVNPNTMQRALTELEREGLLISGGTSGRSVTENREALEAARQEALRELARECAEKFRIFGMSPAQAAEILKKLEKEEPIIG